MQLLPDGQVKRAAQPEGAGKHPEWPLRSRGQFTHLVHFHSSPFRFLVRALGGESPGLTATLRTSSEFPSDQQQDPLMLPPQLRG